MITVVDYGMGNLRSVAKALEMVGAEVCVSDRAEDLTAAERIVLPGQGAFSDCIAALHARGLIEALYEEVRRKGKPFLGICLGMQLLAETSEEDGEHQGLGWLPARVVRLPAQGTDGSALKLPHVGWDDVTFVREGSLTKGLRRNPVFYFAHSYHVVCASSQHVAATCHYGWPFTAAIQHDNVFATQFHPEKSQDAGLRLLENFVSWKV